MNEIDLQPSDRLLSSWKEIAVCLNRGVRTVQRWEQFGMPVQRPAGAGSNVVLAHESELVQWASDWKKRSRLAASTTEVSEIELCAERLNAVREQIDRLNVHLKFLENRLQTLKPVKRFRRAA